MSTFIVLVQSALSQGADIAIQSTHKVLGSMGQSSMLHCQGALVDRTRISRALQTLQVLCPHSALTLRPSTSVLQHCSQPYPSLQEGWQHSVHTTSLIVFKALQ